jgi:hypothetical protein
VRVEDLEGPSKVDYGLSSSKTGTEDTKVVIKSVNLRTDITMAKRKELTLIEIEYAVYCSSIKRLYVF